MKSYKLLLPVLLIAFLPVLTGCGLLPKALGSTDMKKSVDAAVRIYRHDGRFHVWKSEIPLYVDLLHSDNAFVSGAAMAVLKNAGSRVLPFLLAELSNEDGFRSVLESRIESILRSTNLFRGEYDRGRVLCAAADALNKAGSTNRLELLRTVDRIASGLTNDYQKYSLGAMSAVRYYLYGEPGGEAILSNYVETAVALNGTRKKAETIRTIAEELSGKGGDFASRMRSRMADAVSRIDDPHYRASALSGLAVSMIGVDDGSVMKYARSIYNGYNSADYGYVLRVADSLANAGNTGDSLACYRIAIQAAESIRNDTNAYTAVTDTALRWTAALPEYAWEIIERTSDDSDLNDKLLVLAAVKCAPVDFGMAVSYASVVFGDSERTEVCSDLYDYGIAHPGRVTGDDSIRLKKIIETLSNSSFAGMQELVRESATNKTNLAVNLDAMHLRDIDRFKYKTAYALLLSEMRREDSENAWNDVTEMLQGIWPDQVKYEMLEDASGAVLSMRKVSPYPILERLVKTALAVTNADYKQKVLLMMAPRVYPYDFRSVRTMLVQLPPDKVFTVLSDEISYALSEYRTPPEYEAVASLGEEGIAALCASIASRGPSGRYAGALAYAAANTRATNYSGLNALSKYLGDTNLSGEVRDLLACALAGSPDGSVQKAIYGYLLERGGPGREMLEAFESRGLLCDGIAGSLMSAATNKDTPFQAKRTAVALLGFARTQEASAVLNSVLKAEPAGESAEIAVQGLIRMGAKIPPETALKAVSDGTVAPVLIEYLGRSGDFAALRSLYFAGNYGAYYRDMAVQSLLRFDAEGMKIKKLGVVGYADNYVLYCFKMRGYELVSLPNESAAKTNGCQAVLSGTYTVKLGDEKITYVDPSVPDGMVTVQSEEHQAVIRLKDGNGNVLWSVNAYGMGAAWADRLFAFESGAGQDLQKMVAEEAGQYLESELIRKMRSARDSIPFNF